MFKNKRPCFAAATLGLIAGEENETDRRMRGSARYRPERPAIQRGLIAKTEARFAFAIAAQRPAGPLSF